MAQSVSGIRDAVIDVNGLDVPFSFEIVAEGRNC